MRHAGALLGLALLAGCASERPEAAAPAAAFDACDAVKAGALIGKAATPQSAEAARVASGARAVRTIRPGMMVTMDYRADRLNLTVDTKNMVTAIRCG